MATDIKTIDTIQKSASLLKEDMEKDAYELGKKVKKTISEGTEQAKNGLQYIEEQAKSNPLLSIGISFIAGMVVSKLISSSK